MTTAPLSSGFVAGLREAHETYRHLVEGIPAILYVDAADEASTSLYTSPQLERMLGIPLDEWRREPSAWLERVHEDDRERVIEEHRESNRSGGPFRSEYRLLASDGREVWIRDEAVLVRDPDGNPMFWRGIMVDVTEGRRTQEKLSRSLRVLRRAADERRRLLVRLEEAQDEERRRVAADIHDDSIQVLTAAELRAQGLVLRLEDPELRAEAEGVRDILEDAVGRLRRLLVELRPPTFDRSGIVSALRAYAVGHEGPETIVVDALEVEPPDEVRARMFRIAQEAITNARKHAKASRITVTLESDDDEVRLYVADDGVGFDVSAVDDPDPGHIGLAVMIERAELAGGNLRIDSGRGAGTVIEARLPLLRSPGTAIRGS